MNAPVCDFVTRYLERDPARLHMPGHKGRGPLGCEARDITEIEGADSLYEASGILAACERNAAAVFGAGATFLSAGGASQCVRAMLYLAMVNRPAPAGRPVALAARNAHKSFVYAAALCDFDVEWLWPEGPSPLCACPVTPGALAARLDAMPDRPFCVYVTSPDYLGGMQDVRGLSRVCRARGVPLLVDNAHGAYLKFLEESMHPLDLGADMCCDSAHKTLPALTGGAWLHVSKDADPRYAEGARQAMALFGSTSPSYLILQSLDACVARLAGDLPEAIREAARRVEALKQTLGDRGFHVLGGEPMKLTLWGDGAELARRLRAGGVECEFADPDCVVLMFAPDNRDGDYAAVARSLAAPGALRAGPGTPPGAGVPPRDLPRALSVREALFAPAEWVGIADAAGRVCADPSVSCPPAVPVAMPGEIVTAEAVNAARYYGIERLRVVQSRGGNL